LHGDVTFAPGTQPRADDGQAAGAWAANTLRTSKEFLSFFNLGNLAQLPTLREYQDLTDESRQELDEFETQMSLKDLSESAKKLKLDEEPAVVELETAVKTLNSTEDQARASLAAEGIALNDEETAGVVEPVPGEAPQSQESPLPPESEPTATPEKPE
jgi:hypothetical protein